MFRDLSLYFPPTPIQEKGELSAREQARGDCLHVPAFLVVILITSMYFCPLSHFPKRRNPEADVVIDFEASDNLFVFGETFLKVQLVWGRYTVRSTDVSDHF